MECGQKEEESVEWKSRKDQKRRLLVHLHFDIQSRRTLFAHINTYTHLLGQASERRSNDESVGVSIQMHKHTHRCTVSRLSFSTPHLHSPLFVLAYCLLAYTVLSDQFALSKVNEK